MADVMVSIETSSDWRLRMMLSSRALRDSWSLAEMWRYSGNGESDGSIATAEEGDDSASKRACRTAESLDVREGRLG